MGETMVGMSFDKGLTNIANVMKDADHSIYTVKQPVFSITEMQPLHYLGTEGASETNSEAISAALTEAYVTIGGHMGQNGIEFAGAPFVIVTKWSPETNEYNYIAGIPTAEKLANGGQGVTPGTWQGGIVATAMHIGPYEGMEATYGGLMAHIESNGYEIAGNPMEQYIDDPTKVDEKNLRTLIAFPIVKKS
jgi:effector-binding domain-containing protein